LPVRIAIGPRTFFLVRGESGFRLLSNICPHQGGAIYDEGTQFECPQHGWRFDRETGRCLNAAKHAMTSFAVAVEGDALFVDLPRHVGDDHAQRFGRPTKRGLTIELHAHACLEVAYQGFALLTDPWLDGPAFLGAWAPYPPHRASGATIRPDAILITHEHSDHFHEPTLRLLDRATPIYMPDFPNQRIPRRLAALGFHHIRPLSFGVTTTIANGWRITAFEPVSYWNDALVLVDVDGFRLLNINDAGINAHIARKVAPVDVLALQFSPGASGYPWTWAHLTDEQKIDISTRACAGKLRMIHEATSVFGARAVLPFASHFTLWHPQHRAYARMMKRNTLADVAAGLDGTNVAVVELLPGDRWDLDKDIVERRCEIANPFDRETLDAYMRTAVTDEAFASVHPSNEGLSHEELVEYLLQLNQVPEIGQCEDLTVRICGVSSSPTRTSLDVSFVVANALLEILPSRPQRPNVIMTMPLAILTTIVRDGLSWDEAFIGYWCQFDRSPNVYHAGFWRLLQAPYYRRSLGVQLTEPRAGITPQSTVADLVEAHGSLADRILRRHGLYCCGCHHSTAESLDTAARQHGIDSRRLNMMIDELNRAIGADPECLAGDEQGTRAVSA
jgi:CMP-N-acetylneuraminate monooxygenase